MAAKRTRVTKRTIRRQLSTPLAKELASLGNALQSAKLIALAEKVAAVEQERNALNRAVNEFMGSTERAIGSFAEAVALWSEEMKRQNGDHWDVDEQPESVTLVSDRAVVRRREPQ